MDDNGMDDTGMNENGTYENGMKGNGMKENGMKENGMKEKAGRSHAGRDVRPSDALRALRQEFGFRLDEPRERGRERMVAAVEDRLGVSRDTAQDAVYALEHAEVVRFVHGEAGEAGAPMPQGLPRGATAPAPLIPRSPAGDPASPGHWRIGEPG